MVDSVAVKPIPGTGTKAIVIEKVGDEYYPRYKLALGADGEATLVGEDNPLPITDVNLSAVSIQQEDIISGLHRIEKQMKLMNLHLQVITDNRFSLEDTE